MLEPGFSVRRGESLARHSPWRVGGAVDAWVVAHDLSGLGRALAWVKEQDLKWVVLGSGTRVLVREGGLAGAVIRLGAGFCGIDDRAAPWVVGAATPVPALLARAGATASPIAHVAGSVGASVLQDEGWEPAVDRVWVWARGKEQVVRYADLKAHGASLITRVALLPAGLSGDPRKRVRAWTSSWYEVPKRGDLREHLANVALPDVRLRKVAIPSQAPELLVNLGNAEVRDLELLHRSAIERVEHERGVSLSSRMIWWGKRGSA